MEAVSSPFEFSITKFFFSGKKRCCWWRCLQCSSVKVMLSFLNALLNRTSAGYRLSLNIFPLVHCLYHLPGTCSHFKIVILLKKKKRKECTSTTVSWSSFTTLSGRSCTTLSEAGRGTQSHCQSLVVLLRTVSESSALGWYRARECGSGWWTVWTKHHLGHSCWWTKESQGKKQAREKQPLTA